MRAGEVEQGSSHIEDPGKEARSAQGIPVVPAFDGYRAIAILGVLALHLLGASGIPEDGSDGLLARLIWGTVGHAVDILFVVSGFVVFLPTVARNGSFGRVVPYAIRRAARLLPAYWLALALLLVLILTINPPDFAAPGFGSIAAHALGIHEIADLIFGGVPAGFGVDSPMWTLSVEITFYVLLPLVAVAYSRHPFIGLAIAAVTTLLWIYAFKHSGDIASLLGLELSGTEAFRMLMVSTLQFPSWAFSFGLGMTGAWVYVRILRSPGSPRRDLTIKLIQILSLISLSIFAWMAGGYSDDANVRLVAELARLSPEIAIGFSGSLACFMVATALGPKLWRMPFENRTIRKLGDISYGIYLAHLVFMVYLGTLFDLPSDGSLTTLLLWILVVVPPSVLYGYLSARFLEQPIRRWARQFGRTRPDGSN
ncbi:MAG: acyltransferase [Solirubrobacterales bacterium]